MIPNRSRIIIAACLGWHMRTHFLFGWKLVKYQAQKHTTGAACSKSNLHKFSWFATCTTWYFVIFQLAVIILIFKFAQLFQTLKSPIWLLPFWRTSRTKSQHFTCPVIPPKMCLKFDKFAKFAKFLYQPYVSNIHRGLSILAPKNKLYVFSEKSRRFSAQKYEL